MDRLIEKRIREVLRVQDLTDICLCGPRGRWSMSITPAEIAGIRGAIWASGHDPEAVVAGVRQMDAGRLANFDLKPELKHYGQCVPVYMVILVTVSLSQTAQ